MASYEKRGKTWRVQVKKNGLRLSATFRTKTECQMWALSQEQEITNQKLGILPDKTLSDLLDRYEKEVSVKKKGHAWEVKRIRVLKTYKVAKIKLADLEPKHVAQWRNDRLKDVSGSSVCRDWNLLSHAVEVGKKEWGWCRENPFKGQVSRPKGNPPRQEVFSADEIAAICHHLSGGELSQRVRDAFMFALETGMRSGEIVQMEAEDIRENYVTVRDSKNGFPRNVPLSPAAIAILSQYKGRERVFDLTDRQRDSLFRKARDSAGIKGKRFHDARHTAITRLAKKLNVLELARMVGHRNINELLTYYNESAENIAKKLG